MTTRNTQSNTSGRQCKFIIYLSSLATHGIILAVNIVFRPVLPSWNPKYVKDINQHVLLDVTQDGRPVLNHKIPPFASMSGNSPLETLPESDGWVTLLHPEGNFYRYNRELRIVTNSNPLESVTTRDILQVAYAHLIGLVPNSAGLPDDRCEVYLQLDEDPDSSVTKIDYYVVDFAERQIFWAEEIDVARLELEPFSSSGRLKSALTPEFWVHVEYFPCHRALEPGAEEELVSTLNFGYIDDMTAPGSVSPYGAQQSFEYLKALHGFPTIAGDLPNAFRTVAIARLWTSIARIRHIHWYATESPRLNRLQGLAGFVEAQTKSNWALAVGEALCFNVPPRTLRRMNGLWNGCIVYERHWRVFFEDTRRDWMVLGGLGLSFWIASAMALFLGDSTNLPLISSTSLGMASVLVSFLLVRRHNHHRLSTPSQISSYIAKVEDYDHGLRGVSIIYSLPHALTGYSAILLQLGLITHAGVVAGPIDKLAVWFWPFILAFIFILRFGGLSVL